MALFDTLLNLLSELGITNPFIAYLIIAVCAFIVLLIVLNWFTSLFKSSRLIAYKTERGMVQVNYGAISDLVQSICKRDSHIYQLKTKIILRWLPLSIRKRI